MKSTRLVLRTGLLGLLAVLALSLLGTGTLALGDVFDDGYTDCPVRTRLDALSNFKVLRTDDEDKLEVTWDPTQPDTWGLGANVYRVGITLILAEDDGDTETVTLAVGNTKHTFENVEFARDLEVTAAVTVNDEYIISDIVLAKHTSGIAKPAFHSPFYLTKDDGTNIETIITKNGDATRVEKGTETKGSFYYLGFSHNFVNWYVDADNTYPSNPKFRVGIKHSAAYKPDDGKFDHFRIHVEDSTGEDLLGFDAKTIADSVYDDQVFVWGPAQRHTATNSDNNPITTSSVAAIVTHEAGLDTTELFSNIRLSNRHDTSVPAIYQSTAASRWRSSHYRKVHTTDAGGFGGPVICVGGSKVSQAIIANTNLLSKDYVVYDGENDLPIAEPGSEADRHIKRRIFALSPEQIYDLPHDIFQRDGNYVITAWAENEDDEAISPPQSITLSVQETVRGNNMGTNLEQFGDDDEKTNYFWEYKNDCSNTVTSFSSGLIVNLAILE